MTVTRELLAYYEVELLDPVPLHVERAAKLAGVTARLGDARELAVPDGSVDAVLLLGPLHHLADRADRVRALAEACRAIRRGGLVAAATISCYSAIHDGIHQGFYLQDEFRDAAHEAARNGLKSGYRLRVEVAYEAVYVGGTLKLDSVEVLEARWCASDELPEDMQESHRRLLVASPLQGPVRS